MFDEFWKTLEAIFWLAVRIVGSVIGIGFGKTRQHFANRNRPAYVPKSLKPKGKVDLSDKTTAYAIILPRWSEWNAEHAEQLINHMLNTFGHLIFRIIAERNRISWQLVDLQVGHDPETFKHAIRSFYPDCTIVAAKIKDRKFQDRVYRSTIGYAAVNIFPAPLMQVGDIGKTDPLKTLTQAMNNLQPGDRIVYMLWIAGLAEGAAEVGAKQITYAAINPLEYSTLEGLIVNERRHATGANIEPRFDAKWQNVMEDKLVRPLYNALLFMHVDTLSKQRQDGLLSIYMQPNQFANLPFNTLAPLDAKPVGGVEVKNERQEQETDILSIFRSWLRNENDLWKPYVLPLETREIATLWHLPYEGFTASDIIWMDAQEVAAPKDFLRQEAGSVFIGHNVYGGESKSAYLPNSERTSHTAIIGKVGVGKSSLMHTMIAQDVRAGRGVAVIDPTGALVADILKWSIPQSRQNDVVVLDISYAFDTSNGQKRYPPPMNLLAKPAGIASDIAAGMIVSVLEKAYEKGFSLTEMGHTLTMALLTLIAEQQPTLLDIDRIFEDRMYREELKAKVDNIAVSRFWERFEATTGAQQDQRLYPVLRRLDTFYRNNFLYPIMCHPDTLDIASLMAANKIILVSLQADQASIPEAERMVLGATILSQIQMAAMGKAIKNPPYMLYVDEVQNFITTSLDRMFTEARKFGLGLVVANQFFKQLAGNTLDAVMGTVGTLIAFECDETDARMIAPYLKPAIDAGQLVMMGKYRAVVSARDSEGRRHAFTLETTVAPGSERPDAIAEANKREIQLRVLSVKNYTPKSYDEVKKWLDARYKPPVVTLRADDDDNFIEPARP